MRNLVLFIIFLFLQQISTIAQTNLVPDPSLEDTLRCPTHWGDIDCLRNWYQPNPFGSSTDYFHPCDSWAWNYMIIQHHRLLPRTGVAYSYIATAGPFIDPSILSYREYLCGKLSQPLIDGKCYNIQFYIVPATYKNYPVVGMNRIGIWFSADTIVDSTHIYGTPLGVIPDYEYSGGVICDTTAWTRISGSFTAQGGELHFVIGNFARNLHTITQVCNNPSAIVLTTAGVLIDDVSVWPCDAPVYEADAGSDKWICYGDEVILGQNLPDDEYRFLWSTKSHRLTSQDQWDTLATTPYLPAKPEQTTTYYLWVSDFKMDISFDSVTVFVEPCITPPEIPNVFTPNGDGFNDLFAFKNHEGWELETYIRNRWGKLVYEGKNDRWWDGTINGQPASEGVYYYSVIARNHFGQHETFNGVVMLLR